MNKYFSIGEMAKLHNVSIQALRYYDKIGLFKPSRTDRNSKYRYYTKEQFLELDIIKYLKYIGTPLEEIKDILQHRNSMEDFIKLLEAKESVIDAQIHELQVQKKRIRGKINNLRETVNVSNLGEVFQKRHKGAKAIFINLNDTRFEDYHMPIRKICSMLEKNNHSPEGELGFISSFQEYEETGEIKYKKVYIAVDEHMMANYQKSNILSIPKGEYLCVQYKGDIKVAEACYEKLYRHIADNHIKTEGWFYETSLLEGVATLNEADYILEIRALIEKH